VGKVWSQSWGDVDTAGEEENLAQKCRGTSRHKSEKGGGIRQAPNRFNPVCAWNRERK